MTATLPEAPKARLATPSEFASRNLTAIARDLNEHACVILNQAGDSLTFRAAPTSMVERILSFTRKVYRIHCVAANVHLSRKGEYHDLAHGNREVVMRAIHGLLKG